MDTGQTEPAIDERWTWSQPRLVRLDRPLTPATETGATPGGPEGATQHFISGPFASITTTYAS